MRQANSRSVPLPANVPNLRLLLRAARPEKSHTCTWRIGDDITVVCIQDEPNAEHFHLFDKHHKRVPHLLPCLSKQRVKAP